jgi:hypothetical protein
MNFSLGGCLRQPPWPSQQSRIVVDQPCDNEAGSVSLRSPFSEASSLLGARTHGVTSTVTDRLIVAEDENFMKTSKHAQARSGAMLPTWNK